MKVVFEAADIRPLIKAVVAEMLDQFGTDTNRLAYNEAEAAALLGLKNHQLRDARLRGQITGAPLGKRYYYTRADLIKFLESRRAKE